MKFFKRIYYLFITIIRIIKYSLSKTKRYKYLLIEILKYKPKQIMEIGVYNGRRAKEMIQAASIFNEDISYYGFDLFEDFYKDEKTLLREHSKKPLTEIEIKNKLNNYGNINLFKGLTSITLKKFINLNISPDFIFIDGGHSVDTIKNDWKYCKEIIKLNSIVIFDDYYHAPESFLKKFGANEIIDNIEKNKFKSKKLKSYDIFFDPEYSFQKKIFLVKVSRTNDKKNS